MYSIMLSLSLFLFVLSSLSPIFLYLSVFLSFALTISFLLRLIFALKTAPYSSVFCCLDSLHPIYAFPQTVSVVFLPIAIPRR